MLLREPILSLAEAIVGENCKFCGQNVLRNLPGLSIDRWHVDGSVHFPVTDEMPRHDPRLRMPVMWFTIQMALNDIDTIEEGPTQYVRVTHYSGRHPNDQDNPEFEGNKPVLYSYARRATSTCRIRSVGTAAHRTFLVKHAIFYSRSTPPTGHIGDLVSATVIRACPRRRSAKWG